MFCILLKISICIYKNTLFCCCWFSLLHICLSSFCSYYFPLSIFFGFYFHSILISWVDIHITNFQSVLFSKHTFQGYLFSFKYIFRKCSQILWVIFSLLLDWKYFLIYSLSSLAYKTIEFKLKVFSLKVMYNFVTVTQNLHHVSLTHYRS